MKHHECVSKPAVVRSLASFVGQILVVGVAHGGDGVDDVLVGLLIHVSVATLARNAPGQNNACNGEEGSSK